MTYEVAVARRAQRELARLERRDQQRIRAAIDLLSQNPRPPAARKLAGGDGLYRVRVGSFRIVYEIDDGVLRVLVVAIGHRREVYRRQ